MGRKVMRMRIVAADLNRGSAEMCVPCCTRTVLRRGVTEVFGEEEEPCLIDIHD